MNIRKGKRWGNLSRRGTVLCLMMGVLLYSLVTAVDGEAEVYHSVPNETKCIALTFDDGPHPHQTKRILDILDAYGIKATFFMIGVNVENYPDAAREVLARGHEVGNHTYSHCHLKQHGEEKLEEELRRCQETLERICSYRPHLFRPPEGYVSDYLCQCCNRASYRVIHWSVDTRDWEVKDAEKISQKVLDQVRSGDIVLMHDYVARSQTPEALEILLPKLLDQGYRFVTVGELLNGEAGG